MAQAADIVKWLGIGMIVVLFVRFLPQLGACHSFLCIATFCVLLDSHGGMLLPLNT